MKRAAATNAAVASPARRPRRQALIRSGVALAAALALGVLGLVAGERRAPPGDAGEGGRGREHATPLASSAQALPAVPPQAPTEVASPPGVAPPVLAVAAPASPPPQSLSTPVGGQVVAPPQAVSVAARADGASTGGVTAASPAPVAGARPDPAVDGIVLPQAALRPRGPGYRIQLGVFGDAGNALKLYEQVAAQGYEGHIQSRVMVGPFADRAAAEKARQALRRAGVAQGVLVPPEQSK